MSREESDEGRIERRKKGQRKGERERERESKRLTMRRCATDRDEKEIHTIARKATLEQKERRER